MTPLSMDPFGARVILALVREGAPLPAKRARPRGEAEKQDWEEILVIRKILSAGTAGCGLSGAAQTTKATD